MTGPSERFGEIALRRRGEASALVEVILREAPGPAATFLLTLGRGWDKIHGTRCAGVRRPGRRAYCRGVLQIGRMR